MAFLALPGAFVCAHCNASFDAKRPAKFCAPKCRAAASRKRNSPSLTAQQARTLRRAAYWLRDYRQFMLPVIRSGDFDADATAAMKAQCETLTRLAADVERVARGAGQQNLRLEAVSGAHVRHRGDDINLVKP